MGFFDKTRYVRALFLLVPLGLSFIYFSSKSLLTDISDLPKVFGIIENIAHTETYFKFQNRSFLSPTISVKLADNPETYITAITKHINIIDSVLVKGDIITIWIKTDREKNEIVQIQKEGKVIIPYDKGFAVSWGFLVAGIIISFIAIGYLIKYPEDIMGKKENIKESLLTD